MSTTLHSSAVISCCTVTTSPQKRYKSVMAAESGPLLTKTATKDLINIDKMASKSEHCVLPVDDI